MTTPLAPVKFFNASIEVGSGYYQAPVYVGDMATFDGVTYQVMSTSWPFRINGVCPDSDTDWEYANVVVYVTPGSK